MSGGALTLIGLSALAAGFVNALAGGGTLVSFPMLTALGVPAIAANVTNTVALCPGYLGATWAQRRDLRGQAARLAFAVPAGACGGLLGGVLLLHTDARFFRALVPFLILLASTLLALQETVRAWLLRRAARHGTTASSTGGAAAAVAVAGVYGGYFGAGLSVIVLAVLGLLLDETLTRLNALKQAVAFATNVTAAVFFLFSGQVLWSVSAVMAVGALAGGAVGGRLASHVRPRTLRMVVVVIGMVVALIYFVR